MPDLEELYALYEKKLAEDPPESSNPFNYKEIGEQLARFTPRPSILYMNEQDWKDIVDWTADNLKGTNG